MFYLLSFNWSFSQPVILNFISDYTKSLIFGNTLFTFTVFCTKKCIYCANRQDARMHIPPIFYAYNIQFFLSQKSREITLSAQTVDKVGAGSYPQHHFSVNSLCFNKNLKKLQNSFILDSLISKILANFFKFIHANVSPAFISIRAFPMY